MKKALFILVALGALLAAGGVAYKLLKPDYPPRMSVAELAERLDDNALVVIDIRRGGDYDASDATISGARRIAPEDFRGEMPGLDRTREYVLFCA